MRTEFLEVDQAEPWNSKRAVTRPTGYCGLGKRHAPMGARRQGRVVPPPRSDKADALPGIAARHRSNSTKRHGLSFSNEESDRGAVQLCATNRLTLPLALGLQVTAAGRVNVRSPDQKSLNGLNATFRKHLRQPS